MSLAGWPLWPRFQPDRLLKQQLALIDAQSNTPILIGWITAALTAWVFARLDALSTWAAWFALYSLTLLAMYLAFSSSRRQALPPRKRAWIIIVGFVGLGLMWGALVVLAALAGGDLPVLALVATVVASISAAVLGFCGSCWPVYLGFLLGAGTGVNAGFLLHDSSLAKILAVFAVLYVLSMLQFARNLERSALRLIELRFENLDLVARLQMQTQEAEAARARAEASSIDKSRFLAAASHDLRQPVHAIGLFLEALGNTDLSVKQRAIHGKAKSACDASGDMLGTLLDFSRIEAGVVQCRMSAVPLQSLLADLEREYAPQAEARRLHFKLRPTALSVRADLALLSLILRNLISNAVRYTASGGILIGCRRRGEQVWIEVWDTGIGIEAGEQEHIFTEFVQLANAERNRAQGLGLGLAIAQKLAMVMSTGVTVRSRPGRGSVFAVALAFAPGTPPTASDRAVAMNGSVSMPSLHDLQVLVVEDEAEVRDAMQQLLASWGCQCRAAASLDEALALAKAHAPEVLVTDYRLRNGITGRDVVHAVREMVTTPLSCIIVTGDTAPDRLRDATQADALLLHKPLPAPMLYRALAAARSRNGENEQQND
jgi:two-component system, sensor histidine kinase